MVFRDSTGQVITRSYNKMLQLREIYCRIDSTTVFKFVDEKGKEYIHYQLSPENVDSRSQSKAKRYFKDIAATARQQGVQIKWTDLIYDATTQLINSRTAANSIIGLYFPTHVIEREGCYRDVDQIFSNMDFLPTEIDIFKQKRNENKFEYLTRLTNIMTSENVNKNKEERKEEAFWRSARKRSNIKF